MKQIIIPILTFVIGLSAGIVLVKREVDEIRQPVQQLVETFNEYEELIAPPDQTSPAGSLETSRVALAPVVKDETLSAEVSTREVQGSVDFYLEELPYIQKSGALRSAMAPYVGKKIRDVEQMIESAQLLQQELEAQQAAAAPLHEQAFWQEGEAKEQTLAEYRRRKSQAWSDYRTRIEQLVIQHLED